MITSTKFWIAAWTIFCVTLIYGLGMWWRIAVPIEYTAMVTGICASFGLFKTYQNVVYKDGGTNGNINNQNGEGHA